MITFSDLLPIEELIFMTITSYETNSPVISWLTDYFQSYSMESSLSAKFSENGVTVLHLPCYEK